MTKETILKYDGFIDNEYLDKYIEFINSAILENCHPKLLNKHHVIPVCWYSDEEAADTKYARAKLADTDPNEILKVLSYGQHCYAHGLLARCTVGRVNCSLVFAYLQMITKYAKNTNAFSILEKFPEELKETVIQAKLNELFTTQANSTTKLTAKEIQKIQKNRNNEKKQQNIIYKNFKKLISSKAKKIFHSSDLNGTGSKLAASQIILTPDVLDGLTDEVKTKLDTYIKAVADLEAPMPKGYRKK